MSGRPDIIYCLVRRGHAFHYHSDRSVFERWLEKDSWQFPPDECEIIPYVPARAEGVVKPLDEDDYEEIISAAAINMRKATSGIRGQVVTVQDSLDWWVMKETERRILSALTAGKPEQVQSGWQPIETAPKDGTYVLLSNEHGAWVGHYVERYTSGYRPKEPWRTMMMNHWHMKRCASTTPTHWMPLPTPPTAGGGDE